jgi:hypothetical protein
LQAKAFLAQLTKFMNEHLLSEASEIRPHLKTAKSH